MHRWALNFCDITLWACMFTMVYFYTKFFLLITSTTILFTLHFVYFWLLLQHTSRLSSTSWKVNYSHLSCDCSSGVLGVGGGYLSHAHPIWALWSGTMERLWRIYHVQVGLVNEPFFGFKQFKFVLLFSHYLHSLLGNLKVVTMKWTAPWGSVLSFWSSPFLINMSSTPLKLSRTEMIAMSTFTNIIQWIPTDC